MSEYAIQKRLLEKHSITLSKGLGQNFLINDGICPKIADCLPEDCLAVEIGPGAGALTNSLLKRCAKVCAVELDSRMLPLLRERFAGEEKLELIEADAMKFDFAELIARNAQYRTVCIAGNLPYYITSPIIMRLLESGVPAQRMVFMVQKEAAQRICAPECTRAVGAVTLAVRYYSTPKLEFSVSAGSFYPAPKVDSAVISLDIRPPRDIPEQLRKRMFELIKAAFAQRRKTLVNSVSGSLSLNKAQVTQAVLDAGISENARAENVSLEQYENLARLL